MRPRRRTVWLAGILLAAILPAACGSATGPTTTAAPQTTAAAAPTTTTAGPTGEPIASVADGCRILGPGDFEAVGVVGAGTPQPIPGGVGAACRYAPTAGALDAIELHVLQGSDAADARRLFVTLLDGPRDEGAGRKALPEVDDAVLQLTDDYGQGFALLTVRTGRLCFSVSFPPGEHPADDLVTLARVVLARAAGLI